MALTTAYLTSTKDLEDFFNAIVTAQAPEQFSYAFLKQLGFASSNHRLFVGLLKGLGFLDEDGHPTQRYYNYLDQSQSGAVIAEGLREAYGDLFAINKNAQLLEQEDVKNKLRTLTQGKKSEDVIIKMAATFTALSKLGDWDTKADVAEVISQATPSNTPPPQIEPHAGAHPRNGKTELHYNIQIHLPESRDPAVFDAIFRTLREHLL